MKNKHIYNKCWIYSKASLINFVNDFDVNESGMRQESLDFIRKQRLLKHKIKPIEIEVYPELKKPILADGRHRLQIAKELNDYSIDAIIRYYDNNGNVLKKELKTIYL
jgi:hypothetical protein